jgi:putative glutamine amidotransferase
MSTERVRRIGLTMRGDSPSEYAEMRDGLARDWAEFLTYAAPELRWVPIPNLGMDAAAFAEELQLDGLVLTGGADLGTDASRDDTEMALLDHARSARLPVFGVCRGLQVILWYHGVGALEAVPVEAHVARPHRVALTPAFAPLDLAGREMQVNSYHRNALRPERLPASLQLTALSADGWVEGVRAVSEPVSAVMWHPERGRPFRESDRLIFRHAFNLS